MQVNKTILKICSSLWLISFITLSYAQEVIRGPYLQVGTPTSIIVKWRTDEASDSRVKYGASAGNLTSTKDNSSSVTEHEVKLTGLSANTKYYYSIGTTSQVQAGADQDHYFVTAPVAGTKKPTRIWAIGDAGTADNNQRSVRDAYYGFTGSRDTDVWLMLGDNAYGDGEDSEYQKAVFENMYEDLLRKTVVWSTRGNHERDFTVEEAYYKIFNMPMTAEAGGMASGTEEYYSFDYANIHFVCLESVSDNLRENDSPMWTWLTEDLMANDKDWTIAYWHHPPYTKGSHDSDDEDQLIEMRERALPILEDYGVDLVLSGHSHSYERSILLDGHYGDSESLSNGMKIDDGNGQEDGDGLYKKAGGGSTPHEGTVYIVAGSSGKTSSGSLDHPVMVTSMRQLGSVVLDIDGNRLDAKFIDDDGAIKDYFSIMKGPDIPTGVDNRDSDASSVPNGFTLQQNHPNPFNPSTVLSFILPKAMHSSLSVYNLAGQHIVTLADQLFNAGQQSITFDATGMPSGIYFALLKAQNETRVVRMSLTK